jgi:hypothetical protein
MNVLILGVAFAGFGALCLSMERHARQLLGAVPGQLWQLIAAISGWGFLVLSLVLSLMHYSISVGLTAWLGFLAIAATSLGLLLTYAPSTIRYVVAVLLLLGGAVALLIK